MKSVTKGEQWRKRLTGGIVFASVLGLAAWANAIPTMTISDGSSVVTIVDGGAGDAASAAGAVEYVGSVGTWSVVVSSIVKPALGGAADPQMDTLILAQSPTGGNLYVAFSDTDFTGVGGLQANISGHVVAGSPETVGMLVGGNTANLAGTVDATGSPVNFGSLLANIPVQNLPIQAYANGLLPGSAPYSLTEIEVISSHGATSTSIDASIASLVPDGGATVTLLGAALAGLGIFGCFFKRA